MPETPSICYAADAACCCQLGITLLKIEHFMLYAQGTMHKLHTNLHLYVGKHLLPLTWQAD